MSQTNATRLSGVTIALHWLVGLSVIVLLGVGLYMEEFEVYSLYDLHKSFGVLVFAVIIARVIWRLIEGWPSPAGQYQKIEQTLARLVHYILLIGTLLIPLSGVVMSAAGGHGVYVFGIELFASNPDPANPGRSLPLDKSLAGFAHGAHGLVAKIVIAALVLHIAAALKHHIIDKDATLRRMLGKSGS